MSFRGRKDNITIFDTQEPLFSFEDRGFFVSKKEVCYEKL